MKKTALIIWLGLSSPVLGDDWDDLISIIDQSSAASTDRFPLKSWT